MGVQRSIAPAAGGPPSPKTRPASILGQALAVARLTLAASALIVLIASRGAANDAPASPEPATISVVVLPFALVGDPAQDYLADALTDGLTSALARIRDSFVIARNTAFTYRGKAADAKAIGAELNVRHLLQGSVQPSDGRLKVEARLSDAASGAQVWAEQFEIARADLSQAPREIVAHLARALNIRSADIEPARLTRAPPADANAEDSALQCSVGVERGKFLGEEAATTFRLCERALAADPTNVRALSYLSLEFWFPVGLGRSADPEADLRRADELISKALALDPEYAPAHAFKASVLELQTRYGEAIAEDEHALALDPAIVDADAHLGWTYFGLGQFEASHVHFVKAIRLSPRDPGLGLWQSGNVAACFGAKQYDIAIEAARRAIVLNPGNAFAHGDLIAALALTGREAQARDALQDYLAQPVAGMGTIAAFKAFFARLATPDGDARVTEAWDRTVEGLRKAGMPED